ncbi:hypothetical protein MrNuV_ORF073 [Macrobrachium rosenbergii nudivirus]|nr:hypothetical protein MrNuV_ORF073 [Macrobrachium rosenbergii nudivirus]
MASIVDTTTSPRKFLCTDKGGFKSDITFIGSRSGYVTPNNKFEVALYDGELFTIRLHNKTGDKMRSSIKIGGDPEAKPYVIITDPLSKDDLEKPCDIDNDTPYGRFAFKLFSSLTPQQQEKVVRKDFNKIEIKVEYEKVTKERDYEQKKPRGLFVYTDGIDQFDGPRADGGVVVTKHYTNQKFIRVPKFDVYQDHDVYTFYLVEKKPKEVEVTSDAKLVICD